MNKLRYKEIEKNLSEKHGEIAFQVTLGVRKLGLNKYEFQQIREKIYLEAETLVENQMPSNNAFQKKLEQLSNKLTSKALKKSKIEVALNIIFVVFAIMSVCFPILYGMNFGSNLETGKFYSIGLDFYVRLDSIFSILLCFFAGVIIALLFQAMDKSKKVKVVAIASICCLSTLFIIQAISSSFPGKILKFNFILFELIFLALGAAGYFIENYLAKKFFDKKHLNN